MDPPSAIWLWIPLRVQPQKFRDQMAARAKAPRGSAPSTFSVGSWHKRRMVGIFAQSLSSAAVATSSTPTPAAADASVSAPLGIIRILKESGQNRYEILLKDIQEASRFVIDANEPILTTVTADPIDLTQVPSTSASPLVPSGSLPGEIPTPTSGSAVDAAAPFLPGKQPVGQKEYIHGSLGLCVITVNGLMLNIAFNSLQERDHWHALLNDIICTNERLQTFAPESADQRSVPTQAVMVPPSGSGNDRPPAEEFIKNFLAGALAASALESKGLRHDAPPEEGILRMKAGNKIQLWSVEADADGTAYFRRVGQRLLQKPTEKALAALPSPIRRRTAEKIPLKQCTIKSPKPFAPSLLLTERSTGRGLVLIFDTLEQRVKWQDWFVFLGAILIDEVSMNLKKEEEERERALSLSEDPLERSQSRASDSPGGANPMRRSSSIFMGKEMRHGQRRHASGDPYVLPVALQSPLHNDDPLIPRHAVAVESIAEETDQERGEGLGRAESPTQGYFERRSYMQSLRTASPGSSSLFDHDQLDPFSITRASRQLGSSSPNPANVTGTASERPSSPDVTHATESLGLSPKEYNSPRISSSALFTQLVEQTGRGDSMHSPLPDALLRQSPLRQSPPPIPMQSDTVQRSSLTLLSERSISQQPPAPPPKQPVVGIGIGPEGVVAGASPRGQVSIASGTDPYLAPYIPEQPSLTESATSPLRQSQSPPRRLHMATSPLRFPSPEHTTSTSGIQTTGPESPQAAVGSVARSRSREHDAGLVDSPGYVDASREGSSGRIVSRSSPRRVGGREGSSASLRSVRREAIMAASSKLDLSPKRAGSRIVPFGPASSPPKLQMPSSLTKVEEPRWGTSFGESARNFSYLSKDENQELRPWSAYSNFNSTPSFPVHGGPTRIPLSPSTEEGQERPKHFLLQRQPPAVVDDSPLLQGDGTKMKDALRQLNYTMMELQQEAAFLHKKELILSRHQLGTSVISDNYSVFKEKLEASSPTFDATRQVEFTDVSRATELIEVVAVGSQRAKDMTPAIPIGVHICPICQLDKAFAPKCPSTGRVHAVGKRG